jgi:endonuclease/exonuclease/phosphatase family metal-dependent hydrolase
MAFGGCSPKAEFNAASFNIRYDAAADSKQGDGWDERKGDVAKVILTHDFDIVGTQEGDNRQIEDLAQLLPDYDYTGHPYGGKSGDLHTATIFYKREVMECLEQGTFWYSPTPEVESIGWDATDLRLCHWGLFRHKPSGKEFYFFNSHLYWKLEVARANSGRVHVDMIKKIAGDKPVISVGDFNSEEDTKQVKDILEVLGDSYRLTATPPQGCESTNLGGGNFIGPAYNRIDFIFVSDDVDVNSYITIEDKRENGHYPSDHLPIVSRVTIE